MYPQGGSVFAVLYAVIVTLGLGVASLQLLPTAELARLSLRSEMTFTAFVSYSLPFRQSITLLFPYLFGTYAPGDVYSVAYFGAPDAGFTGYTGLLTLMLAIVGALAPLKRAVACFWAAVGLFAFLLVLGDLTPLAKAMYHLPVVNKFRAPTRHFIECALAVSVLAGLGVAAIKNRLVTAKLTAVVVAASGTTILLSLGVILWRAEALAELAAAKGVAALSSAAVVKSRCWYPARGLWFRGGDPPRVAKETCVYPKYVAPPPGACRGPRKLRMVLRVEIPFAASRHSASARHCSALSDNARGNSPTDRTGERRPGKP